MSGEKHEVLEMSRSESGYGPRRKRIDVERGSGDQETTCRSGPQLYLGRAAGWQQLNLMLQGWNDACGPGVLGS